jgi:hypothetical protein
MTVEELKVILEELPNECKVILIDIDGDKHDVEEIKYCKVHKPNHCEEVVEIAM